MGEVWRYLVYVNGRNLAQFGDDREHVVAVAKLIEQNSFSEDWRIDVLIFSEYFQSVCETGSDILKIPPIDVKGMSDCFGESPPGKDNYKQCIRELVINAKWIYITLGVSIMTTEPFRIPSDAEIAEAERKLNFCFPPAYI